MPSRPSGSSCTTRETSRQSGRNRGLRLAAWFAVISQIVLLAGCRRPRDPQAVYDHARETLRRGDPAAAASEAERGFNEFHNKSVDWSWKFTILRARALYSQGKSQEALAILASGPAAGPTGESGVQKLRWQGLAYTSLHKFSEAEQVLSEAEQLCSVSAYRVCGDVLGAEGDLEMERGDYAVAQSFFERVLPLALSSGDRYWQASALLDLSWAADEQAHFDDTLDWADAARSIAVPGGYADIAQTALGNMGWAYYKLGDTEKALNMFVDAEQQAAKLGDITDQIRWLTDAGYIHMDAGDLGQASRTFTQALQLAMQINSREPIINSLIALAFVSEQTDKLEDAKRYADEALAKAQHDQNGRDIVYPELVLGRLAARSHDVAAAEKDFHAVAGSPDSPVFLKWEAQRSLARLDQDEGKFDTSERGYRAALSTFETARSELRDVDSRLPFLSNATHIYDDYIGLLIERGKIAEALQVADFSRARTLQEGLGLLSRVGSFAPELLDARQIASHAQGTILYYWLGEKSYLWAITPRRIALFPLPSEGEIRTRVQRYRTAIIEQRESTPGATEDGVALYRILVEPAKDLIARDARVFILPDGCLNGLNFETLRTSGPTPHYWIEDATLSIASSLRMLRTFQRPGKQAAHNLLLLGDPVAANEDFPQLPNAAVEVQKIASHFGGGQRVVFTGVRATPSAYLASRPERFSLIDFVAHGTASRLSPLDSAIVLSRGNTNQDSYKLNAREIVGHRLHAELVTISSCRSAGERAYSGEGLVGLAWAFVAAGAHNVIGALWDVSDASSPQLMDELYGELKRGTAPDRALRQAKLMLLRSSGALHKPFYWAPFQLYNGS
jgi:CHAT domain-containing protein/Flp pilus assembly protein TadD